jgi:hypothetical protein
MVSHFGHFLHRPSGMSRFRDLRLGGFGFFTKVVVGGAGGGVTAGSADSIPSVFLLKDVVAILTKAGF